MAIDVSAASARAGELRQQAENLRAVRGRIDAYKNVLSFNWQGVEVQYYISAINKAGEKITNTANALDSLAGSIESTANQIRAEEIAEEQRKYQEWLAEQQRIAEENAKAAATAAAAAAATTTKKKS